MKHANYWTENTPQPSGLTVSNLPPKADVAIIGSGYTGLNAAIELKKSGADVVVLDQGTIGWGGSSRNGGLFSPDLAPGMLTIEKRYGTELAKYFWQWTLDACDYVERIVSNEGMPCDFDRSGQVYLAYRPNHLSEAKTYTEYLAEKFGHTGQRVLDAVDVLGEIGSKSYYGGILEELGGGADPAKYTFGLASLAERTGVRLVENAKATKIRPQVTGFRIESTKGEIESAEVLLATSGYTSHLIPRIRFGVFPIATCIVLTEPLSPDIQKEISPNGRVFYDSKRLLNYFRLTADGRLLFGGRKSTSEDANLDHSSKRIHRRMLEVFPQLKGIRMTHTWSGYVGYTFDKMPHIGRDNGIHYAYGYCGHGLAAASYLGVEVAKIISGKQEASPFMEIPHPRYFFASFEKLFMPVASLWYRFMDKIS